MAKKKSVGSKLKKAKTNLKSYGSLEKFVKKEQKFANEKKKPAVGTAKRMVKRMKKEGVTSSDKENMVTQINKMKVSPENKEKLLKLWKKK